MSLSTGLPVRKANCAEVCKFAASVVAFGAVVTETQGLIVEPDGLSHVGKIHSSK